MTAARRLRAASVQMEHRDGDREANFTKIERFVAEAAAQGAQLVVFPECCVCGYWFIRNLSIDELTALAEPIPEGPSTQRLRELAQRYRITVGAGWATGRRWMRARRPELYGPLAVPTGRERDTRELKFQK